MTEQIALFVDPEYVEQSILKLRQVDGVKVRLDTKELVPSRLKEHPQYSMSFGELAPIIISVTGMLSSFVALGTAIVQLKTQNKAKGSNAANPMIIVIGEERINVTESFTADELEIKLRESLKQMTEANQKDS